MFAAEPDIPANRVTGIPPDFTSVGPLTIPVPLKDCARITVAASLA